MVLCGGGPQSVRGSVWGIPASTCREMHGTLSVGV